jgi:hypothetical protein
MRQRVLRQCCTRGRFRPAHPRQLAGVPMGDDPARRFLCARCRVPVLVCSRCDRGQIYCPTGCAAMVRRQAQRDAGRRYQRSRPGRFKHAARTRRWRERRALLAVPAARSQTATTQSVTHQGSPLLLSDAVLAALPSPAPTAQPCPTITTSSTPTLPMPGPPGAGPPEPTLTLPIWRCGWCHAPCAVRVRLDFLRRSRPARKASAQREPSHGHSP